MVILAAISVVFKAAVRKATRSASVVDLGDIALVLIMVRATGGSVSTAGPPFLAMPDAASWIAVSASFLFLYLSGRLIVSSLGIDRMDKEGISAGGAAHSLRKLGRPAAMAAAFPYCLAGALLEELLFRHMLYSEIAETMGPGAASILQAVAFSAVHGIPALLLRHGRRIAAYAISFPFISGLMLQSLYSCTGSVASPTIVHWALNVSAVWRASLKTRQVYDDAR